MQLKKKLPAAAGIVASSLLFVLSACSHLSDSAKPSVNKDVRAQLSIGYSLLYQEANGIPKLEWLLKFKDKPEEMGKATTDLVTYYGQLADRLKVLSSQFPAVRLDATVMSSIEADTRKSIGTDHAKHFAPVIGKSGTPFEREALLMFYDALDEQRHLVGVMQNLEADPALKKFLESTKVQLDLRYEKIGQLLDRKYFTR